MVDNERSGFRKLIRRRVLACWHKERYDGVAQRTNVLLVDDDITVRQSLEQVLTMENFRVVPVANGHDALREFGEKHIDIVLLDLNLGSESGWDTFDKLKRIRPLLPVIIMTGNPGHGPKRPTDRAEAFMEKPLDLTMLCRKLTDLATQAAAGRAVRTVPEVDSGALSA